MSYPRTTAPPLTLPQRRQMGLQIDAKIGPPSPTAMGTSGGGLTGFHRMQATPSTWEKMQEQASFDGAQSGMPMPAIRPSWKPQDMPTVGHSWEHWDQPAIPVTRTTGGQGATTASQPSSFLPQAVLGTDPLAAPPNADGSVDLITQHRRNFDSQKANGIMTTPGWDPYAPGYNPDTFSSSSSTPTPPPADNGIYPDMAPAPPASAPPMAAPQTQAPDAPKWGGSPLPSSAPAPMAPTPPSYGAAAAAPYPSPAAAPPSPSSFRLHPSAFPQLPPAPAFQPPPRKAPPAPLNVVFNDPFPTKTMHKSDLLAASVDRWNEVSSDPLDPYRRATTPEARDRARREFVNTPRGQQWLTEQESAQALGVNREQNRVAIANQRSQDNAIARHDANTRADNRITQQAQQTNFMNNLRLHEMQFKDATEGGAQHAAAAQVDHYLKSGVIPPTAAETFTEILSQPGGHKAAAAVIKFYEEQHKAKAEASQKPLITDLPTDRAVAVGSGASPKIHNPIKTAPSMTPRIVKVKEGDTDVNYVAEPDGNGGYRLAPLKPAGSAVTPGGTTTAPASSPDKIAAFKSRYAK